MPALLMKYRIFLILLLENLKFHGIILRMSNTEGIKITKEKANNGFPRGYLIFTLLFGAVSGIVSSLILKMGISPDRYRPAVNPFYTESVNYPPTGSAIVGTVTFLAMLSIYFFTDCFLGFRLKGFKKAIFVMFSIVLIFTAVEFSMNAWIRKHPPLHRPHPSFLWEVCPHHNGKVNIGGIIGTLKTESHGFRGEEVSMEKPPGTFRIMILGDSSAFGYGVNQDEVFAEVLQKMLRDKYPGKNIEVINGAVMGYTTFSSRNFFLEKGLEFEPDAIIISHNNDPDIDLDADKNRVPPQNLQPLMKLLYKSNIYMAIRREILNRKYGKTPEIYGEIPEEKGVNRVSQDDLRKNLETIMNSADKKGMKILTISMPRNDKVDREEGEPDDLDDELLEYRRIMKEVTVGHKGVFVDILKEWKEFPSEYLFIDSMHPTAEGHKKIAGELYRVIVTEGWITGKNEHDK